MTMNTLKHGENDIMKGKIPENILGPVIDSLSVELTLIDTDDKYIMWSEVEKPIFNRPDNILGKDVMVCHPEKSHPVIKKLLDSMKSGEINNKVQIIEKPGPDGGMVKIRMEYLAIRDSEGKYLGCLELCNYIL